MNSDSEIPSKSQLTAEWRDEDEDLERFFDLWSMSSKEYDSLGRLICKTIAIALIGGLIVVGAILLS